MLQVQSVSDEWRMVAPSGDVSSRVLIGRWATGSPQISPACQTSAAAARTDDADCELERERSGSQLCGQLGTSLSRCLLFSHHSTSLITARHVLNPCTAFEVKHKKKLFQSICVCLTNPFEL